MASRRSSGKRFLSRYLTIMDSMSRDELDGKKVIQESRIKVIARGSGTSMVEVQMLLEEYKNIGKMIGNLSGLNMGQGRS
jgi:signal recognition particle subunit SRP54